MATDTYTEEFKEYWVKVVEKHREVKALLQPYSTELSGLMNWAKQIKDESWLHIVRFCRAYRIMEAHTFNFQKFQVCTPAERAEDFCWSFAQLLTEYPEAYGRLAEWSKDAAYRKEVRKNNAAVSEALVNLESNFASTGAFRSELMRLTGGKACVNCGSKTVSVFTWDPKYWGRYRTSNRIWYADMRKTPLTKALLEEAMAAVEERYNEGR